ncbi:MAG: lipoprotein-releasing ABC transporter ATP-binding protein LolD [Formivibrio sp.]|nr:lipoprotein-releasing ABC transporter ATP-binding protein LolD [Formivibrio sp.]
MNDVILKCVDLAKTYQSGDLTTPVLEDVNFELQRGETVAVVGASGSGKSTLLHCLGALDVPSGGSVELMGENPFALNDSARSLLRNKHLGFVYQFHHLLPEFTAQENVAMPLFIRRMNKAEALKQAAEMLDQVGLSHRLHHKPGELSGGERQRAAVARALVTRPDCVLADEPTGNLDRHTAMTVFEQMLELSRSIGTSFVIVTHDMELAAKCGRIMKLADGRIVV